ncbi:hypothetical protein [Actinomadura coerulea]
MKWRSGPDVVSAGRGSSARAHEQALAERHGDTVQNLSALLADLWKGIR